MPRTLKGVEVAGLGGRQAVVADRAQARKKRTSAIGGRKALRTRRSPLPEAPAHRLHPLHLSRSACRIACVTLRPSAFNPSGERSNSLACIVHSVPRVAIRGCVTSLPRRYSGRPNPMTSTTNASASPPRRARRRKSGRQGPSGVSISNTGFSSSNAASGNVSLKIRSGVRSVGPGPFAVLPSPSVCPLSRPAALWVHTRRTSGAGPAPARLPALPCAYSAIRRLTGAGPSEFRAELRRPHAPARVWLTMPRPPFGRNPCETRPTPAPTPIPCSDRPAQPSRSPPKSGPETAVQTPPQLL